jgi:hypothetical protein
MTNPKTKPCGSRTSTPEVTTAMTPRTAPRMSKTQRALWRAAGEAAEQGDLIKALVLFEAGRVA